MTKVPMAFLMHHGVQGMKWGHRKGSSSSSSSSPKRSRKELRKINKEGKEKFYNDRLNDAVKASIKHPDATLVKTRMAGVAGGQTVAMLGSEFTARLMQGAAIDKYSTVVASVKTKQGQWLANAHMNDRYQKVKA